MKKLALTLAALATVSAVASAKEVVAAPVVTPEVVCPAPVVKEGTLVTEYIEQGLSENDEADTEIAIYMRSKNAYKGFRATSFGMEAEWEHENSNFNALAVLASVGMAYGDDWTFGLTGVKFYDLPRNNQDFIMKSTDARAELWMRKNNKFSNGARLDLGARIRAQKNQDRWALRVNNYSLPLGFTTLSGWGLVEYRSINGSSTTSGWTGSDINKPAEWKTTSKAGDFLVFEVMPLNFNIGPVKLGYYFYGEAGIGSSERSAQRHQARAYFPLYNEGKFSSNMELRYTFKRESKDDAGKEKYGFGNRAKSGGYKGAYLNLGYKVTPQFNLYSYIGVFPNEWEFNKNANPATSAGRAQLSNYDKTTVYTDIGLGFGYAF